MKGSREVLGYFFSRVLKNFRVLLKLNNTLGTFFIYSFIYSLSDIP